MRILVPTALKFYVQDNRLGIQHSISAVILMTHL